MVQFVFDIFVVSVKFGFKLLEQREQQ